MNLATGTKLGSYEILSLLGAGGMGQVYLAQDTKLRRKVALKLLSAEVADNRDRLRRFVQEAEAAAALNHPNVAHIYEVNQQGEVNFIAMEYVEGETLRSLITNGRINISGAVHVAMEVAGALSAAHEAGIVHRDIKPENIMLRPDGYVKVLDFGLAKLTESKAISTDTEAPTIARFESDPGTVLGTANYMSPEQARGQEVDVRTDIFSLGVVLYEMAAGRTPFEGESTTDVLAAILVREPPPLARYSREAPETLEWITAKALRKNREERYQTAKELLSDLRELKQRLEFQAQLERSTSTDMVGMRMPATSSGTTAVETAQQTGVHTKDAEALRRTSSAEYIVSEIKRHKKSAALFLLALVIALSAVGYYSYFSDTGSALIDSIAVLPFDNQGGDENAEYFSDGITESIIYSLSQLPNLRVTPRNSAFRYKGKEADAQAVGRELGVQALLMGRVAQRGDNLSISAELVDARANRLLWGEQYNRKRSDILAVQEEIAKEISEKLRLRLTGEDQKQLTRGKTAKPEAYERYLMGRYLWNKRRGDAIEKSIEYFNQAIAIDPNYALAYAGLADSYVLLSNYTPTHPKEAYPKAMAAATMALAINDKLAEAHTTLAYIKENYEWDLGGAETEFKRGIELNPNYPTGHQWYGEYLSVVGRHEEAIGEFKKALELDPLSLVIHRELGNTLLFAGQHDQAIEQLRKTFDIDSSFPIHRDLGWAYTQKAMYGEAIAQFQTGISSYGEASLKLSGLGYTYAVSGKRSEALKVLERLEELSQRVYVPPTHVAAVYAGLGDKDKAFQWLEKAYRERDEGLIYLNVAPPWVSLRSSSQFTDLTRRIGLPQ